MLEIGEKNSYPKKNNYRAIQIYQNQVSSPFSGKIRLFFAFLSWKQVSITGQMVRIKI